MNVLYGIDTSEIDGQGFLRVETASLFRFVDADSASTSHITLHHKTKILRTIVMMTIGVFTS